MKSRRVLMLSLLAIGITAWASSALAGGKLMSSGVTVEPITVTPQETTAGGGSSPGALPRKGIFDHINLSQGLVWIDDSVYRILPTVPVMGTDTKLGSLSAIQHGEVIGFRIESDTKDPESFPMVVEIQRN